MKSILIRLSLSLIGLIGVTTPHGAFASTRTTPLHRPLIHIAPDAQNGDPSIIG